MELRFEDLRREHWPHVLAIYRQGLAGGQATFETDAPTWEQWNESHLSQCRLAALRNDQVAGWAALSPVSSRAVYRGVAEVSIYVLQELQGMGVGRQLLQELIKCSEEAGFWTLQASLFPENAASLGLFTSSGFRVVGRRERIAKHHGTWRDTILLERRSQQAGTV